MPRKKKESKAKDKPTYYKAKNGRFYKKIQVDGKTRCRFVSNAEATGTIKAQKPKSTRKKKEIPDQSGSTSQTSPPPKPKRKRRAKKKIEPVQGQEDAQLADS